MIDPLKKRLQAELFKASENEKKVIGCVLKNPKLLQEHQRIDASYFYFANTRAIFKAITKLIEREEEVNDINVYNLIKDEIEGVSVISECIYEAKKLKNDPKKIKDVIRALDENLKNRNMLRLINLVDTVKNA